MAKKVIVMDFDNTITKEDSTVPYESKTPNLPVIEKIREYKELGFEIIIHTARRMRTHQNDEAKVLADIGVKSIQWLQEHNVPFDGIKFGKPYGENGFYVDDKTIRPSEFLKLSQEEIFELLDKENHF